MDYQTGFFYLFAAVLLFAAYRVVTARNPVHAVLFLMLAFSQAAALWLLLKAEFLGITLVLVAVIIAGTWGLLRDSLALALQGVPESIDTAEVRAYLAGLQGVSEVHDLHIWAMSTTENALTVHLVMPGGHPGDAFLQHAMHDISHRFGIHHSTLQVELSDSGQACGLAPDSVV